MRAACLHVLDLPAKFFSLSFCSMKENEKCERENAHRETVEIWKKKRRSGVNRDGNRRRKCVDVSYKGNALRLERGGR